ncbi:MAG: cell division protein ZapE [Gammaproteobacteria bacterium]|nr:cell division protein ZapE [Gammaproteobacteria bacterium]
MPKIRYQKDLQSEEFNPDLAQLLVVDHLHALEQALLSKPTNKNGITQRIKTLFGKKEPPAHAIRGLYIYGTVGRGKTYLMDLFYDCLPPEEKMRMHFHRFMHEIHHRLNQVKNEKEPLKLVADHFRKRTRILCLDELFVADIGDAMLLSGLLSAMFESGITLVTTSNCTPDDLYKEGLQRARFLPAIELLKNNTNVVELGGDIDHRLQFLQQADIYHYPLDESAEQVMLDNFHHIAPDAGKENELLEIEERSIQTKRSADGVVWFEFDELCNGPRSAADYIEIARCFNTVLISNLPDLTHNNDIARRFITAIDEFYDRSVKLVISASAEVDQLYQGKKLAFEFQRTVSRLIEMRSKEYLAKEHKSL